MKLYVTRIPEITRDLSTSEAIWEVIKALMGAQIAKDKPAQRQLKRLLRQLQAQAESEEKMRT